jgi:predicted acylesterase/phospholipase RssA
VISFKGVVVQGGVSTSHAQHGVIADGNVSTLSAYKLYCINSDGAGLWFRNTMGSFDPQFATIYGLEVDRSPIKSASCGEAPDYSACLTLAILPAGGAHALHEIHVPGWPQEYSLNTDVWWSAMKRSKAASVPLPRYDCVVLSGGGAKGAYGAGAAKAVLAYRHRRGHMGPVCFIGTSAGSLNAAVLATAGPDALIQMWKRVRNADVLGVSFTDWKLNSVFGGFRHRATISPHFSIYSSKSLRRLIGETVEFAKLADAHLIICATDFTHGRMFSYFASELVARMVAADKEGKLAHLRPITDQAKLTNVLLASSSIPVAFPPVKLDGALFVDGGIGNHTPTREAAYFLRHLGMIGAGMVGDTYCIRQDPLSAVDSGQHSLDTKTYVLRTIDVYHHIHTDPIVNAWERINDEVDKQEEKLAELEKWVASKHLAPDVERDLIRRVRRLAELGGTAKRISTTLIQIQPGADLGDSLDFRPKRIGELMKLGWNEGLKQLSTIDREAGKICTQLKSIAFDEVVA